jgi:L-gulono-1,4-lactone dehydrogenase
VPDGRRPGARRRRRRRRRPRPPGALRARRLDRADLARRQPVEDHRRAGRARRRPARGEALLSPTWHNHTGNQTCHPREILRPGSLAELVELVQRAEREGTTVRLVGAGHSWSDVALTEGLLLEPSNLGGLVELDDGSLRPAAQAERLVRVRGGTHLRDLNAELDARGLALPNMGGYDAQTIGGVVSTSTHGSGIGFGPFPDMVRSMDLVIAGGEIVRVEPVDGPTDPLRFTTVEGATAHLIQDDDTFAAAVCGMGCLGLISSLVLEVRDKFWLNEVRTLSTWEEVRDHLTVADLRAAGEHYELFVNPYAGKDGRHRLLVTVRTPCPDPVDLPPDKLERHPLTELASSLPLTGVLLRWFITLFPKSLPGRFDKVLADMCDDGYASVSYKVFNIGAANDLPAYSMELGVSVDDASHVATVDRILEIAERRRREDGIYETSPFSLRFVAPSRAFASMMYGRATMMIELIMVNGSRRGYELLAGFESELADLGVRSHWGQYNQLTPADLPRLYPEWPKWKAVHDAFNSSGVFASPFTQRVGIS